MMNSHSLTFNFTQNYQSPTLIESTIGHIFKRFAHKPQDVILNKIMYKEVGSTEESTFETNFDDYGPEDRERILAETRNLHEHIQQVILRQQTSRQPHRYTPPAQPAQPLIPVAQQAVPPQPGLPAPGTPERDMCMFLAGQHSVSMNPGPRLPPLEEKRGPASSSSGSSGPVIDDID
jgi:hypothetical protein